jgi:hypothetical protein
MTDVFICFAIRTPLGCYGTAPSSKMPVTVEHRTKADESTIDPQPR